MRRRMAALGLLCLFALSGCSVRKLHMEKLKERAYELVEEPDIPGELEEAIRECESQPFFLTFADKGRLYVARGYGRQETGGYQIQVSGFYESEDAIVLETTFLGPEPGEGGDGLAECPYLVIWTEYSEKDVVIE